MKIVFTETTNKNKLEQMGYITKQYAMATFVDCRTPTMLKEILELSIDGIKKHVGEARNIEQTLFADTKTEMYLLITQCN